MTHLVTKPGESNKEKFFFLTSKRIDQTPRKNQLEAGEFQSENLVNKDVDNLI